MPPQILTPGQVTFRILRRFEKVERVVVVLFEAGRDRQDVEIEHDVGRVEAESIGQQAIGALADFNLATGGVGLAAFVERHHDERGAVSPDDSCLAKEVLFALLQADRVDDRLALDALQARLEHRPLRAVDHERQPRDLGLRRNDVQERRHRRLRVEHPFVHVDVEDVRAAAHLFEGNRCGIEVLLVRDHAGETLRSGDVGPLADDDQRRVGTHGQCLQPGEVREVIGARLSRPPGSG